MPAIFLILSRRLKHRSFFAVWAVQLFSAGGWEKVAETIVALAPGCSPFEHQPALFATASEVGIAIRDTLTAHGPGAAAMDSA